MTIYSEKVNSLKITREFLRRLLSPYNGGYKGVKKEVREEAIRCLRHWPNEIKIKDDNGKWQRIDSL